MLNLVSLLFFNLIFVEERRERAWNNAVMLIDVHYSTIYNNKKLEKI